MTFVSSSPVNEIPYAEVIGDPILQSKSPSIHNFWIEKLGLEANYDRALVHRADLGSYLEQRRADPLWRGCNVTMPHKQTILPLLDRLDPLAKRIGAVNTVVRENDGQLVGYNTDAAGFMEPLQGYLKQTHLFRMARILGTGGAARAIVAALSDAGFVIVLAGRNPRKAQAMLDELATNGYDHHAIDLEHFAQHTDFAFDDREQLLDIVANASPLGMAGQSPLHFDFTHAPPQSVVYDIVTHPLETPFLHEARALGFPTVDGLSMLIGQAAEAFAHFFGKAPPRDDDVGLRALLTA